MYKDMREIIELILSGDSSILTILLVLLLVWLFKEIRMRYVRDIDLETIRIEQILKVCGELELKIIRQLEYDNKESRDSLLNSISTSYSFLSRELFKKCVSCYDNRSKSELESLLIILREEISSMNYEISKRTDIKKKDVIEYYINILNQFFIPAVITFGTLLLLMLIIVFVTTMNNPEVGWFNKLWISAQLGSSFILFFFIYVLFSMWIDKKLKNKLKNWIYIILVFLVFALTWHIPYFGIIYFCALLYFIFYKFPKVIQHNNSI